MALLRREELRPDIPLWEEVVHSEPSDPGGKALWSHIKYEFHKRSAKQTNERTNKQTIKRTKKRNKLFALKQRSAPPTVQPQILPPCHRHKVAEPLMRQLVANNVRDILHIIFLYFST